MSTSARKRTPQGENEQLKRSWFISGICVCGAYLVLIAIVSFSNLFSVQYSRADYQAKVSSTATSTTVVADTASVPAVTLAPVDTAAYAAKMIELANYASTTSSTTVRLWPTKAPYPLPGALLPFHRIVAYYGNFYSTKMGVLGKYPPSIMIPKLLAAAAEWQAADPNTPVIPAIDYIAVTAQGSPGADGKYRARMPASQIQEALTLANQVHGIVILDIQVGLSSVQTEVPLLEPYLKMPNVELALDPEFDMKTGAKPGTVIGTMSSSDVNFAANYLAKLVHENNIPPKILIVHRFTENMVTGYQNITPLPEVQIVMDMDGWGSPAKKVNTYTQFIHNEPVQFTGFKLFYVNDLKPPSTRMLTPAEVLKLSPQPLFIQYQ